MTKKDSSKVDHLTKIEAARREINAAIRMYFANEDPLAIHSITAGGMQLIQDLGEKQDKRLGIELGMHLIREERQDEVRILLRKPQNFIKHSDRLGQENAVLDFHPAAVESYLLIAAVSYKELTGMDTPETRTFAVWVQLREPNLMMPSIYKTLAEDFHNTHTLTDVDKPQFAAFIKLVRAEKKAPEVDFRP